MEEKLQVIDDNTYPFYCLEHFLIKIKFQLSSLSNTDPNSIEDYAQLLHEYTHYLQTITTINGISTLLSFIDKFLRMSIDIAINIAKGNDNSHFIIKYYKDDFKIFNARLSWDKKSMSFPNCSGIPAYISHLVDNPILKKQSKEIFIYNSKDGLYYHVSTTMLRENMAMMAVFSIRGIGQDVIMDHVSIYPSIEKPYSCEYWLIFNYFFIRYPDITNLVKFTYYFCELALMVINTGEFIEKLLIDIDKIMTSNKYENEDIFFNLLWKLQVEIITDNSNIITTLINNIKKSINNIVEDNEFYYPFIKILELAETGLRYKQTNCISMYNDKMDSVWLKRTASLFLSPLILQPNGKFTLLFDNNETYKILLGIFFGVTVISKKIIKNEHISYCPFLDELPICDISKDNILDICSEHPLDIPKFEKGGCLFYNTALILGLLKKSELEKYINDSE